MELNQYTDAVEKNQEAVAGQFPEHTYPEISRLAVPLFERDYSASIPSLPSFDPDLQHVGTNRIVSERRDIVN